MRIVLAALTALLAAPASASFRCPAKGGAQWREYRSAHFLVDTDAARRDAESLVRELEHFQALLLQALVGEPVEIPGHLRVRAFADQTDFTEFAGTQFAAGYYELGAFREPTIVFPVRAVWKNPELVAHELAHHLSFYLFPVQPHWFSEGLAEWVQTAAARPGETAMATTGSHLVKGINATSGAMAGSVPANLVSWFRNDARPMTAKELLTWSGVENGESGRGHLWSWLLYHWLWNQRTKAFADYQKRLADSGDPDGSWRAAFPEFDPSNDAAMARLDDELDRYRRGGRFAFYRVQADGDGRFTEASISSSDLHLLLLGVQRGGPREADKQKALRRAVVEEALAEDPANPSARYLQALFWGKVDPDLLRDAVKSRPGDWRGWFALSEVAQGAEQEAASRKAAELNPQSAIALNQLAWVLATSGRAKEALAIANRALDLAPWDPNIVDTLAEVAVQMGKCAEALQLEKRAVAVGRSDSLRKRQAEVEQRCKR